MNESLGSRVVSRLRTIRSWVRQRLGLAFYHPIQVSRRVQLHGNPEYGGWRICPDDIKAESIVYSFGVGEDISFDLSLIQTFHLRVWAFDPTPRSIAWVNGQPKSPNFVFHPYGIAHFDGIATFHLPDNPDHVSGTLLPDGRHGGGKLEVPVKRLANIMAELGHQRLDILKLDIEGAEYAVLEDVLRSELRIDQILVEFHPPLRRDKEQVRRTIRELNRNGYLLFAVGESGDCSFIKTGAPSGRA
jgi:FkbM family methyltransferase